MIVEFSAPPGSGKSSIAKAVSGDGFKLIRLSAKGEGKAAFYAEMLINPIFSYAFARNLFRFCCCYRQLPFKRKVASAFISAQTRFLRSRGAWYIRDQGFFQLGDWVPRAAYKDSSLLSNALEKIDGIPDAVVFFDIPVAVVCDKLERRGDIETWEKRALERGYSSLSDRLSDQASNDTLKYEVCKKSSIAFVIIRVSRNEEIDAIDYYFPDGFSDHRYNKINELVDSIKRHWRPLA